MIELAELEQDILKEIFNMGLGQAASTLSEMVDAEVDINVPRLKVLDADGLTALVEGHVSGGAGLAGMRFQLDFAEGDAMNGAALFAVARDSERVLVNALFGEPVPPELFSQVEEKVMTEVGDLLLYTCASSLSHYLDADIEGDGAAFVRSPPESMVEIFPRSAGSDGQAAEKMMALEADVNIVDPAIKGLLVLMMDWSSRPRLQRELNRFIEKMGE